MSSKVDAIVFVEIDGKPVPAGRLAIEESSREGRSSFAYGRRYLERRDAIALDPVQLPLDTRTFRTAEDYTLFNGIRDAAPDAWGRRLIDIHMLRAARRPALEQDFLLAAQCGHRMGALRFGPTPVGPGPVLPHVIPTLNAGLGELEGLLAMSDAAARTGEIPEALVPFIGPAVEMGGARPKATVLVQGFPWLAKFSMGSDRIDMPAAEAGCLDLCAMAGLDVPERRIETIADRRVLLVQRFDRCWSNEGLRRIPMISSLTLLGAHEMDRGVSGYADIHDGLRRYGSLDGAAEDLFRRMVMNVLCGNTDDHYRNHALLNRNGRWTLGPVYDVTPTLQASSTKSLFLHLGRAGCGREATLQAAVEGASAIGLGRDRAVAIANELSEMVGANWRRVMTGRGASTHDIAMMENSFSEAGRTIDLEEDIRPSGR